MNVNFHYIKRTDAMCARISEGSTRQDMNWRLTRVVPFTLMILNEIDVCLVKGTTLVNLQEPMSHQVQPSEIYDCVLRLW